MSQGKLPRNNDALDELYSGQRELANLASLLEVMELAAETDAEGNIPIKVDWWALVQVARRQLTAISPHLGKVEMLLLRKAGPKEASHGE